MVIRPLSLRSTAIWASLAPDKLVWPRGRSPETPEWWMITTTQPKARWMVSAALMKRPMSSSLFSLPLMVRLSVSITTTAGVYRPRSAVMSAINGLGVAREIDQGVNQVNGTSSAETPLSFSVPGAAGGRSLGNFRGAVLSKFRLVDQRMRRGCSVSFRQLRTTLGVRWRQLWGHKQTRETRLTMACPSNRFRRTGQHARVSQLAVRTRLSAPQNLLT